MFSRCPHCETQQPVSTERIRENRGLLNCVECGKVFDVLVTLSEQAEETFKVNKTSAFELQYEQTQAVWRWRLGGFFMLLVLLAQIVYFEGGRLLAQPVIHAALTQICLALNCQLPVYHNPEDWALSHSDLQTHLGQRYLVTSALSNQSEFAQSFPRLKLTLTNFKGQAISERLFDPKQYSNLTGLAANQTTSIWLPIVLPGQEVGGFSLSLM